MKTRRKIYAAASVVLLAGLACSLPFAVSTPPPPASESSPLPPDSGGAVPAAAGSATPPPLAATIMASQHEKVPADVGASGPINYDVDSSGTGPEHRAPYGDSYDINLFERPFTQIEMEYLPPLDIVTFQISEDGDFYIVSIDLVGGDPNDELGISYGVELDTDIDGNGDYYIEGSPPYATDWLAETVRVYEDTDNDTGGPSPERSDAVYPGNGYDRLIFDRGQGDDKDLAWVRANPQVSAAVQLAFKRSLAGSAFMWGAWADAGIRDPGMFNYNDRFEEPDAGSPEKSEKYYPIREIYQADNTCWPAYGFKPTGFEPHLCPSLEPQPTKHKAPPTPGVCTPIWTCLDFDLFFTIEPPIPPEP